MMGSAPSDPMDRIASALESIAQSFAVVAMAMLREDEEASGSKRNPLRTMEDSEEPS